MSALEREVGEPAEVRIKVFRRDGRRVGDRHSGEKASERLAVGADCARRLPLDLATQQILVDERG